MCGRYTVTLSEIGIAEYFGTRPPKFTFKPRYNLAPGQEAPVVVGANGEREQKLMSWGLIPHWAKEADIGYKTINARAETVASKPAFRDAFQRRRCLVVADSFYEWKRGPLHRGKEPYRILMKGREPFALAGLWDLWQPMGRQSILSFTILTIAANNLLKDVHGRMPVILPNGSYDQWLRSDPGDLSPLLKTYPEDDMELYRVGSGVNSAANDGPDCIQPAS